VGDADIGEGTNIGAGTVFANYDGVHKHHTRIGRGVRTSSNNTFVAPVDIGDGAATGAGTVVRRNVPPGALAVSGGPQREIAGWTERRRAGTPMAQAAEAARREEASQADDPPLAPEAPPGPHSS
jgi:bifunctional UDP-N-acetylglucosamine pyrophosphorylase/glucosamine-1-phosphate N-acetyltransferase